MTRERERVNRGNAHSVGRCYLLGKGTRKKYLKNLKCDSRCVVADDVAD